MISKDGKLGPGGPHVLSFIETLILVCEMQKRTRRPHGPAVMEHALAFEEVQEHRNVCCRLYTICLEVAVRRKWVSFTCRPCSLWRGGRHRRPNAQPAQVLPLRAMGGGG